MVCKTGWKNFVLTDVAKHGSRICTDWCTRKCSCWTEYIFTYCKNIEYISKQRGMLRNDSIVSNKVLSAYCSERIISFDSSRSDGIRGGYCFAKSYSNFRNAPKALIIFRKLAMLNRLALPELYTYPWKKQYGTIGWINRPFLQLPGHM